MICFACGKEIEDYPCPFCGYNEDDEILFMCPNLDGTVCTITENICYKNSTFMECEVKIQAEKESFI